MLPAPAYVLSDAHLGFATRDAERSLLDLLRHAREHAGSVVINGDLFEFWFEWRHVMPRPAFRVLAALADLRDAGIPVVLIAGNHDCWGGDLLRQDVGIDYRLEPWDGLLGGWRAHVAHGDGLRPAEDRGYRMLRAVLRNPVSIALFRWLHPDLGTKLASATSNTSRNHQPRDGGAGLQRVAGAMLDARADLELVIFAHAHVASLQRVGRGVYANAGAWMDGPTFLRITPDRVELCRLDAGAITVEAHLTRSGT